MANPPLQSPTNPHFFQPLLPGFDSHLTIPAAFFSKHIDGRIELKTAKLRSDASYKTWKMKMDGRRLTKGWKEFATTHDFRIGDIIVFKHEGDMMFHVTIFGPSCCEIQYAEPDIKDDDEDTENQDKISKVLRKKKLKPKTVQESSFSYDYCFVAEVTTSNLRFDKLDFPKNASSSIALNRRFQEIIVVNKEGKSWTLKLRFEESAESYYIKGGWRRFCRENRQRVGDLIPFNLVGDGKSTPLICICPEEASSDLTSKYKNSENGKKTVKRRRWVASSSQRQNRFVTIKLTAYNIKNCKLILPARFAKINGLNDNHKKIILMDKHGVKRLTKLVKEGGDYERRGLGKGWKVFCEANDVLKIGKPFVLELLWEDEIPLLRFCSNVKNEPICV